MIAKHRARLAGLFAASDAFAVALSFIYTYLFRFYANIFPVDAAKGSAEISKNIVNVSEAARSTTQGANNTLNAASELARLAADLKRVVEQAKA